MGSTVNRIGQEYGLLSVVSRLNSPGQALWNCRCECGAMITVRDSSLSSGSARNCGCPKFRKRPKSETSTPEFMAWRAMRTRCLNPNTKSYHRYGGRGISICSRWLNSPDDFLADMGPRPSSGHSIDRIDNDGNYEPSNCRWATWEQQNNNRGSNVWVSVGGVDKTLAQWSRGLGGSRDIVGSRIAHGWTKRRAVRKPVRKRRTPKNMSDKVINGQLPARVCIGWRAGDKHLSFTGLDKNRSLPHCDATIAIRDLLESIYADATPYKDGIGLTKPRLGAHFQIRWTKQGGSKLRFYLATTKKSRPQYDVPADARTIKLRAMVQEAYDQARTKAQHAEDAAKPAKTAFEVEAEEYEARLLAGQIVEPAS